MTDQEILRSKRCCRIGVFSSVSFLVAALTVAAFTSMAGTPGFAQANGAAANACSGDSGITLSPGFCASIFADNLGHVRHMVVAPSGVLYVNTWSGRYYHNDAPPMGGFIVALKDGSGNGRADKIERFGPGVPEGSAGGTGIALYKGGLFVEQNDKIIRYALPTDTQSIVPNGSPETILSGLPLTGDHPMHPFVIDAAGHLYVDLGSATNACQADNRVKGSPGHDPCTELETRGGTWRYDANKTGQHFSPAERYATGIRNGEGLAFDSSGRLFVTQHGRDQLSQNWPNLYKSAQSAELPAEELLELRQGADYGWPECYFDGLQKKLVLAPEYGGDGTKIGVCARKTAPAAFFPAHWAPNDLLIYTGTAFPTAYRGGAFIAFHGSWNRAPAPQGGYNVVFQPLKDGKSSGNFIVFADGFAGAFKEPGRAAHRPTGLAMAPDGALYISDDVHGRIWRVTAQVGGADVPLTAAPAPNVAKASSENPGPPEGMHADAGRLGAASLPVPPGSSKEQIALGDRIFHGEASDGTCAGCHGSDAKGSPQAPSLVDGNWFFGDGSLKAIRQTIADGVPRPRNYSDPMPPKGGTPLSDSDVNAVAAYVWAISHTKGE